MKDDVDIPDDALEEIGQLAPNLTQQERKFVYWRSMANPPLMAFKKAGYMGGQWRQVETRPKIREALADLNERLEPEYRITQQKVISILMEAVDLARLKEQPKILVEAATALANISGVAAATKFQIDSRSQVAVTSRRQEDVKALQHLPRKGLEDMVGVERTLPTSYIEAEYVEIEKSDINQGLSNLGDHE